MKKYISLTPEGKAALEAELQTLIDGRSEITEKIATARAFGDLSENEDYSAARSEQKVAEGRILEIQDILKNAKIITEKAHDVVALGATVKVQLSGREYTYQLVGTVEADPLKGKISDDSPVGRALLGKKPGDTYSLPNGNTGTIISV